jgi:hypothetical protein
MAVQLSNTARSKLARITLISLLSLLLAAQGLVGYLKRLEQAEKGSKGGILTTHPGTEERLENVRLVSVPAVDTSALPNRNKRFADMTR